MNAKQNKKPPTTTATHTYKSLVEVNTHECVVFIFLFFIFDKNKSINILPK
jgi:hypothetical protein